ncbi:hypothetical protein PTKIN_Ptkin06aG0138000 [Pterospermum kingtungense]
MRGVVRDEHDVFVIGYTAIHEGLLPVKEAEALCLFTALEWLLNPGYNNVQLSNAKVVVDAIRPNGEDNTEFG